MFSEYGSRISWNRMKSRSLLVILCFGLLFSAIYSQLTGLHLENGYYLSTGSAIERNSIVANRLKLKSICDITEYNENIDCQYAGSSKTVGFIYIDCKDLMGDNSMFALLTECKSRTKLSKDRISYESCIKAYCDTRQDMALSLLVIQAQNENEFNNAYSLSNLNFRFKESSKEIRLSPNSIHLLFREGLFSFSGFEKATEGQWNSPFYGKFIVYYTGTSEDVPTLDFVLHTFGSDLFNYLTISGKKNERSKKLSGVISASETLVNISWILITQMEMYWSRGVLPDHKRTNSTGKNSVFDDGLSNRVHCSLGPHSFLLNFKPYIDSFEHELESSQDNNVNDTAAVYINNMFDFLGPDIDSFFILPSQYEITSDNFTTKKNKEVNFMDANFPCMNRHRKDNLTRFNLHEYSYNSIIKFGSNKKNKVKFSKPFLSRRIIYEDVYSLIHIVDVILSFLNKILDNFEDFKEQTPIDRYFTKYKLLIKGVREIRDEVESVCSLMVYTEYTMKIGKTKQSCSLRYSIGVAKRLHKLYYKTLKEFIENDEYKKYYLYSTEHYIKSSYCLYNGVHENNYIEIPNEVLGRVSLYFSNIHRKEDLSNENSIYEYCYNYFNRGSSKKYVDIVMTPKVCRSFSKCLMKSESMDKSIVIFNKLKSIDLTGDFDKKVSLVADFCRYSRSMFPIKDSDPNVRDCRVYRFFQLIHRSSMLISDVKTIKFKLDLRSKEGYYYFVQDGSIASYVLINDFCTDPDITEIIQCNIDLSESNVPMSLRRYNSIKFLDGSRILTPLYFKSPDDESFLNLANGVLFAKILDNNTNSTLRLSYFGGLTFPYSLDNPELSRKECEAKPLKYSYSPEASNPQRVLVLKLSYFSSSVAYVKRDYFNPGTLTRNSKIFKEKFSVPDLTGISIPLVPSIVQIEDSKYSGSICNYLLYPYLMLTEFVNPHDIYDDSNIVQKSSTINNKRKRENTLDNIKYPVGLFLMFEKISSGEPLALNFIVTSRGYRFLYKTLKASYMISYLFTTMLISFWTGGKKYRQHCDLHGENVLLRIPSDWMKYKWEQFLDIIINNINLSYFSIIDLDYSYESELNVSDVIRDLSNFPDKDPCSHPSVSDGNEQLSMNDYQRVIEYICPFISLNDLFQSIYDAYPSKKNKKEAFGPYSQILELSDFTYNYCDGIKDEITKLAEKEELTFLTGYNYFRDLRREIWNSILRLNELEDPNKAKVKHQSIKPESENGTNYNNSDLENLNLVKTILFSDSLLEQDKAFEVSTSGNLRALSSENKIDEKMKGIDSTKRLLPKMLPSIINHALYFYCSSISTNRILHKNNDYKQILNFYMQRSSLEDYIRQVHFGFSFDDFGASRLMLNSIEKEYRECIENTVNRRILVKLLDMVIDNPNIICPKRICTDIRHFDLFESLVSVYRYHFDHLISSIYDSRHTNLKEERVMDIKVFMVERDLNGSNTISSKKPLKLNIHQIRSIIEMRNFCIRDGHYSSLQLSRGDQMYSGIQCKENPEFSKYGIHANGLLIIQITYFDTIAHESMIFPWIYNTKFSVFESLFSFKETTNGISVIGQLVSNNKQNTEHETLYIHKGDKSIYDFNSHVEKYSVPPSILNKLSIKQEQLFRSSFMSKNKIKSRVFDAFYLYNDKVDNYSINLYDWLKNTLTNLNNPVFSKIPGDIKSSIVYTITKVVSVFKKIWIPVPECRYSEVDFPCFPMFCGISSKNIIIDFNKTDNSINNIKFLFVNDMIIVDSFEYDTEFYDSEDNRNIFDKNRDSSSIRKLRNKFLELTCGADNSNANDIISVASTLRTLLSTIENDFVLDINKMFSSKIEDIHYNFSNIDLFETVQVINGICTELRKFEFIDTNDANLSSYMYSLC
ncbi:hypothetical protein FG386_003413 [Cryptosporidium ryanae]|uniref:uncharacterized protein n=1 Tax=Cryptosporidium ryanae TaxID=515981 RepID=UPI00351AAC5F|nr:hypothetical protein FG386_003413 [Cryptosporidium ryanae]